MVPNGVLGLVVFANSVAGSRRVCLLVWLVRCCSGVVWFGWYWVLENCAARFRRVSRAGGSFSGWVMRKIDAVVLGIQPLLAKEIILWGCG